jgi:hypothetical protein
MPTLKPTPTLGSQPAVTDAVAKSAARMSTLIAFLIRMISS